MQRFKQYLFDTTPSSEMLFHCITKRRPRSWPRYADGDGKFIYGTFSPAGLARVQLVYAGMFEPGENVEFRRIECMILRQVAAEEGFYLP